MASLQREEFLVHHGVKGQQWGVRNGPPYPIEDKVLRKGSKINTIQPMYRHKSVLKQKALYGYNPEDEWDSKVYRGPFAYYDLVYKGRLRIEEHSFEVTKDLKMPTSKERVDNFIELFEKENKLMLKDLEDVQKLYKEAYPNDEESKMDLRNDPRDSEFYKKAYALFGHALEDVRQFTSGEKYLDLMATKYDAMVDDNNVNVYNGVHDPVIIFRAEEVLKTIGDSRMMFIDEIYKNMDEVSAELSKRGRRMVF